MIVVIHQNQSVCNNNYSGGGSERIRISIHWRRRPTTRHPLCNVHNICIECISRAILGGKRFGLPGRVPLPTASRGVYVCGTYIHPTTHTGLRNAMSVGQKYILWWVPHNNCFLAFFFGNTSVSDEGFSLRLLNYFLKTPGNVRVVIMYENKTKKI